MISFVLVWQLISHIPDASFFIWNFEHELIAAVLSTSRSIYFLFLCNADPSLRAFLSFCNSSADISDACSLWRWVLRSEMRSKSGQGRIRCHAGIFECQMPVSVALPAQRMLLTDIVLYQDLTHIDTLEL